MNKSTNESAKPMSKKDVAMAAGGLAAAAVAIKSAEGASVPPHAAPSAGREPEVLGVEDRNHDGVIDAAYVDTNGDGIVDAEILDVNEDGVMDVVVPIWIMTARQTT